MSHEFISLNRAYLGWVLAKLHGKSHTRAIGLCIGWKFKNLMHHHRQFKEHSFNLLDSLRRTTIQNMSTFVKSKCFPNLFSYQLLLGWQRGCC